MTQEEAVTILKNIKYKLDFTILECSNVRVYLAFKVKPSPGTQLLLDENGLASIGHMKGIELEKINEIQFLALVYDLFAEFEVHECSEFFEYNGLKPFNSHNMLEDKGGGFVVNIVAPRIKDIDLHYVENCARMDKEARESWNRAYKKLYELENMSLYERIKFLFTRRFK